jgi:hypothetical protein
MICSRPIYTITHMIPKSCQVNRTLSVNVQVVANLLVDASYDNEEGGTSARLISAKLRLPTTEAMGRVDAELPNDKITMSFKCHLVDLSG